MKASCCWTKVAAAAAATATGVGTPLECWKKRREGKPCLSHYCSVVWALNCGGGGAAGEVSQATSGGTAALPALLGCSCHSCDVMSGRCGCTNCLSVCCTAWLYNGDQRWRRRRQRRRRRHRCCCCRRRRRRRCRHSPTPKKLCQWLGDRDWRWWPLPLGTADERLQDMHCAPPLPPPPPPLEMSLPIFGFIFYLPIYRHTHKSKKVKLFVPINKKG